MITKSENGSMTSKATLGGGCFWCLEAVYQEMKGVTGIVSGYMGGHVDDPTYQEVCGGGSGHVEVVEVSFDPSITSFREVLAVFFTIHDPTTRDRQGNDEGPQYRSAIFFADEQQKMEAAEVMRDLEMAGIYEGRIVTELRPAERFWPAEDYHQNYYRTHPMQPYCLFVVGPKVKKFRERFS
ncbi:MAG: peptide-methionine (S)-S-oxide reductase MsrA [Acidobacteria bacterium]|nr:peptide-methionine (S)-S-oxide reductase MsrA [Acidobacteriota bacterium]